MPKLGLLGGLYKSESWRRSHLYRLCPKMPAVLVSTAEMREGSIANLLGGENMPQACLNMP